ncbi:flagellar biosynthesis protein A [Bacillus sp. SG-1]|nr:flagellar biosynthesis protein A [Bacillus sp. SG-1]
MFIDVRSTNNANEILIMMSTLNSQGGKGMISMATMRMTLNSTDKSLADICIPS